VPSSGQLRRHRSARLPAIARITGLLALRITRSASATALSGARPTAGTGRSAGAFPTAGWLRMSIGALTNSAPRRPLSQF